MDYYRQWISAVVSVQATHTFWWRHFKSEKDSWVHLISSCAVIRYDPFKSKSKWWTIRNSFSTGFAFSTWRSRQWCGRCCTQILCWALLSMDVSRKCCFEPSFGLPTNVIWCCKNVHILACLWKCFRQESHAETGYFYYDFMIENWCFLWFFLCFCTILWRFYALGEIIHNFDGKNSR